MKHPLRRLRKLTTGHAIVADIHFHYKRAIEAAKMGASCLRINPGNIGSKDSIRSWQSCKR